MTILIIFEGETIWSEISTAIHFFLSMPSCLQEFLISRIFSFHDTFVRCLSCPGCHYQVQKIESGLSPKNWGPTCWIDLRHIVPSARISHFSLLWLETEAQALAKIKASKWAYKRVRKPSINCVCQYLRTIFNILKAMLPSILFFFNMFIPVWFFCSLRLLLERLYWLRNRNYGAPSQKLLWEWSPFSAKCHPLSLSR